MQRLRFAWVLMRHRHSTRLGGQHGEEGKGEDRREEKGSCEAQGSQEEEVTKLRSGLLRASRRLDVQPGDIKRKIAKRRIAAPSVEMTPGSATEGVGETEARTSRTANVNWMSSGCAGCLTGIV
jgi:hypothetical protein